MTIGDVNSQERGSGARYNDNKPDFSLIPLVTLEDEVRVWMYGEKKYARFNWMKGMNWSIPLACALRHLSAFQQGEDIDPESGQPHLAHAMCNLRMLTLYTRNYPEGDDRPTKWLRPDLHEHVARETDARLIAEMNIKTQSEVHDIQHRREMAAVTHALIAACEKGDL